MGWWSCPASLPGGRLRPAKNLDRAVCPTFPPLVPLFSSSSHLKCAPLSSYLYYLPLKTSLSEVGRSSLLSYQPAHGNLPRLALDRVPCLTPYWNRRRRPPTQVSTYLPPGSSWLPLWPPRATAQRTLRRRRFARRRPRMVSPEQRCLGPCYNQTMYPPRLRLTYLYTA